MKRFCPICNIEMSFSFHPVTNIECKNGCFYREIHKYEEFYKVFNKNFHIHFHSSYEDRMSIKLRIKENFDYWRENDRYLAELL